MKNPALILCSFLLIASFSCHSPATGKADSSSGSVKDTIYPLGFLTDTLSVVEGRVRQGEVFGSLMSRLGVSPQDCQILLQCPDSIFDPRKLRSGNSYQAYFSRPDSVLHYLVYNKDYVNSVVFRCTDSLSVWLASKPTSSVSAAADVTITSSLWNDMIARGVSPQVILALSDIYAWTVDFFALHSGDRFRFLYSLTECEGRTISVDSISLALFSRDSKEYPAIRFHQGEGGSLYWNEKGESLRRAFLKAPLSYSRISSGFSYNRRHPITRKVQPHTAVDYAAPAGTPVMSIGDGTVLSAGYSGAGGNMVKIRHNATYTTAYLHLSRFARGIKAGSRVRQGEVIGYVGSTGRSTGPHLDFRVWKNGTPVNPLKMESPSIEPLKRENMPVLDSIFRSRRATLDSLCASN